MTWFIFIIIALTIGTIIFLTSGAPGKKKNRQEYLGQLAKFLEGELRPMEQFENAYSIKFNYSNQEFIFEDIEEKIFDTKGFKALLKTSVGANRYTLEFTERPRTAQLSNVTKITDLSAPYQTEKNDSFVPRELKVFNITTNNYEKTVELFNDHKAADVFKYFKSEDGRGRPVMSLEIIEGILMLKFHSTDLLKPNLIDLQHNIASIENYLEKMLVVAGKLKSN